MSAPRLTVPDAVERDDLAVFVARTVRLDAAALVRLRDGGGRVDAWGSTPFDVLVTRGARGAVEPADTTVAGSDLLAALSVVGGASVEAGTAVDGRWRGPLPGPVTWSVLDEVPGADVEHLAEQGVAAARDGDPSGRPSPGLLDQVVLTVGGTDAAGAPDEARVPMRCIFALAGLGFADGGEPVRVSTGGGWIRLDARGGAVVRRRWTLELRPA